ncbi:hypothetical protein B0H14DRAFT_3511863 [Mycena olivaceomarginata]|nr:hypothetical protein B0H14DRAFT_3511863 [Mycena olivaceomarginata]
MPPLDPRESLSTACSTTTSHPPPKYFNHRADAAGISRGLLRGDGLKISFMSTFQFGAQPSTRAARLLVVAHFRGSIALQASDFKSSHALFASHFAIRLCTPASGALRQFNSVAQIASGSERRPCLNVSILAFQHRAADPSLVQQRRSVPNPTSAEPQLSMRATTCAMMELDARVRAYPCAYARGDSDLVFAQSEFSRWLETGFLRSLTGGDTIPRAPPFIPDHHDKIHPASASPRVFDKPRARWPSISVCSPALYWAEWLSSSGMRCVQSAREDLACGIGLLLVAHAQRLAFFAPFRPPCARDLEAKHYPQLSPILSTDAPCDTSRVNLEYILST